MSSASNERTKAVECGKCGKSVKRQHLHAFHIIHICGKRSISAEKFAQTTKKLKDNYIKKE